MKRNKDGSYSYTRFDFYRILNLVILGPISIIAMLLAVNYLFDVISGIQDYHDIFSDFIYVVFLILGTAGICHFFVPKYSVIMNAVRKYLTYKELVHMINKERFELLTWDNQILHDWKKGTDLYLSEHWIATTEDTFIPRNMIVGIVGRSIYNMPASGYMQAQLVTLDGKFFDAGPGLKIDNYDDLVERVKEIAPNFDRTRTYDEKYYFDDDVEKKYKTAFRERVKTKEDFVDFVYNNIDLSYNPLIGTGGKERHYKRRKDKEQKGNQDE
jgi:hypothetical protein